MALGADGGGIYSDNSDLTIIRSTIDGNEAGNNGGGVTFDGGGNLNIYNSTVSNNFAQEAGGGLESNTAGFSGAVSDSTFYGNSTYGYSGGGIINFDGELNLTNSTISGNTAGYFAAV